MKRIGNIYEKVIDIENLKIADQKAQRGKKHQFGVIKHNKNKENDLEKLRLTLKNNKYKTGRYTTFPIFEPKRREISRLSYYPNRIVHHALMQFLEPVFTKCFIAQTYSCIKKRGIHKGLKDVNKALRDENNTDYCLKIDIKKFYPSVNKEILKDGLRRKFKDNLLLNLLDEIIDSNPTGLPLGNYLSQWMANYYLNNFDHWLKEIKKIKYYFRYCDDLVILHSSKEYLHALRKEIQEYLKINLLLDLSNYQVFRIEDRGIDFLGYRSFHKYILIRNSIKKRWKRMLLKYPNKKSIASYNGWLLWANTKNLKRKYEQM